MIEDKNTNSDFNLMKDLPTPLNFYIRNKKDKPNDM